MLGSEKGSLLGFGLHSRQPVRTNLQTSFIKMYFHIAVNKLCHFHGKIVECGFKTLVLLNDLTAENEKVVIMCQGLLVDLS